MSEDVFIVPSIAGILEVLYCVLIESPEVLNIIQENHIKSIISLLDKHGRNHKVKSRKLVSHSSVIQKVVANESSWSRRLVSLRSWMCCVLSVCVTEWL